MKMIYVGEAHQSLNQIFDIIVKDNTEALKEIRHLYKAGTQKFYLDIDDNSIIQNIKTLRNGGKMKHIKLICHNRNGKMPKSEYENLKDWVELYD